MRLPYLFAFCFLSATTLLARPIYITNQLEGSGTAVFDPLAWRLAPSLPLEGRISPLVVEPDGNFAWAISPDRLSLKRVDLRQDGAETDSIPLAVSASAIGCVGPKGPLVWSSRDSTLLHFVDLTTLRVLPHTLNLPGTAELFFSRPNAGGFSCVALMVSPPAAALLDFDNLKATLLPLPSPAWDLAFSSDGRFMAASHPLQNEITVRDLKGEKLFKRVGLPGHPRGLAWADSKSLWVSHQQDDTGRVSLLDLAGDSLAASIRLVGLTYGLALVPSGTGGTQLLATAYIPELKDGGMLYALDPASSRILDSHPLPGKPWRLVCPAAPPEKKTEKAKDEATPAGTTTAEALPVTDTPAISPARKYGLFRGCFEGVVWNKKDGNPVPGVSVSAFNRRGRQYDGGVGKDGRYRVEDLPWGTYEVVAEAPGYQKLVLSGQTLALTDKLTLDLKMEAEKDQAQPKEPESTEP